MTGQDQRTSRGHCAFRIDQQESSFHQTHHWCMPYDQMLLRGSIHHTISTGPCGMQHCQLGTGNRSHQANEDRSFCRCQTNKSLLVKSFSVAHLFGLLWRICLAPQLSRDRYLNSVAHMYMRHRISYAPQNFWKLLWRTRSNNFCGAPSQSRMCYIFSFKTTMCYIINWHIWLITDDDNVIVSCIISESTLSIHASDR
jgi:hypothetical protein